MRDWLGTGEKSPRQIAENIITECIRRIKLEAKNDHTFVPTADDASAILAGRQYVIQPVVPPPRADDTQHIYADRIFGNDRRSTVGTPLNIPWTVVGRDGAGAFSAGMVQVTALRGTVRSTGLHDFVLYEPDGLTAILRVPTATPNIEIVAGFLKFIVPDGQIIGGPTSFAVRDSTNSSDNVLVLDNGNVTLRTTLKVTTAFGCNGQAPQTAFSVGAAASGGTGGAGTVGGSAGATYTATEQTLINALASQLNANASIINAQAAEITALSTLVNNLRTALINDGIAVT